MKWSGGSRGGRAKISVFDFKDVKNIHRIGKPAKTRPTASPRICQAAVGKAVHLRERFAIAGHLAFLMFDVEVGRAHRDDQNEDCARRSAKNR